MDHVTYIISCFLLLQGYGLTSNWYIHFHFTLILTQPESEYIIYHTILLTWYGIYTLIRTRYRVYTLLNIDLVQSIYTNTDQSI